MSPHSVSHATSEEDIARIAHITRILLLGMLSLSSMAFLINVIKAVVGESISVSAGWMMGIVLFFSFLYLLLRKGYVRLSACGLLAFLFILNVLLSYQWGVDLPLALLGYGMVIMMSGILLGSRIMVGVTLLVFTVLFGLHFLQQRGMGIGDRSWRELPWETTDTIVTCLMLMIVATVCWLSNREIEKSLYRARASEAELKQERDQLEITVQQRTEEIQEIQAEKIAQLYRFAEFGKLSSGLFHDLLNPLNSVSLNIERLKVGRKTSEELDRAVAAARKLQQLVAAVHKQLGREEQCSEFSINEEVRHALDILAYKARAASVVLSFPSGEELFLYGSALKFNQIVLNLVANAIDAYAALSAEDVAARVTREVHVSLGKEGEKAVLCVRDQGVGIAPEALPSIFEPFFTTKEHGHGIGLSLVKRIVEKEFHGSIRVTSDPQGTVFTVHIPLRPV